MRKILITGAAGFVGQNLIPLLMATEKVGELILVDKHPIPQNIISALMSSDIRFMNIISDQLPVDSSVRDVDSLICLAGATSVDAALSEPKKAIDENISIAVNLAEWSRNINSAAKVIYMSSDEVLGESFEALGEDAPLNPTQPYAVSKSSAEMILHNYRDVYKLNIITLRSCNMVGVGQKKPKLIPAAVYSLSEKYPMPIHGDGNQLREWMAVEDLCRAIILLLQSSVPAQVYQATSGIKYSVNDVVKIIADGLMVDLQFEQVADRLVQDKSYAMKTTRLSSLGWQHAIDPKDAIIQTVVRLIKSVKNNTLA